MKPSRLFLSTLFLSSLFISTQFLACAEKETDSAETDLEISNVGPSGASHSENSCAPDDGLALELIVGVEETDQCTGILNEDFAVIISIWSQSITSDTPIDLSINEGVFLYNPAEPTWATEGEVTLSFEGDWQEGTTYTGYYWMELTSGLLIEGSFSGAHCGGNPGCG